MANSVNGKVKDGLEEGEIEDDVVVEDSRNKGTSFSRSHGRMSSNSKRPVAQPNQRQQLRIPRPNAKGVVGGGGGGGSSDNWERTRELLKNALNQSSENVGRSGPRAKPSNSSDRHRERSNSKPTAAQLSSYKVPQDLRDKMSFSSSRRGPSSYSTPPIRAIARDYTTNKLVRYPWYRTKRYPSRTPVKTVRNSSTPRPMPRQSNAVTSFSGVRPPANNSISSNLNSNKPSSDNKKKTAHDDCSYEDLLLQYKSIQSQLEDLKREEAKSDHNFRLNVEDNLDKENFKGESRRRSWKDDARFGKLDRFSLGAEALRTRRRRNRSRLRTLPAEPRPSGGTSAVTTTKTTQDEDDEMELRRIALASKLTRKRRLSVRNSQNSDSAAVPSGQDDCDVIGLENATEGAAVVQGCDNYEEVAMELDSNCGEDLVGDLGDELEDEDEVALRNHLLLSLNMKKKTKKPEVPQSVANADTAIHNHDPVVNDTEMSNETDDNGGANCSEKVVTDDDKALQNLIEIPSMVGLKERDATDLVSAAKNLVVATSVGAPIHKRVVINLAEDSSDSESDDNSSPLLSTIDQLLKEGRRTAETKQAVLRLSGAQVQEYCRLKEEIAKREQVVPKSVTQEEAAPPATDEMPAYNKQLGLNEIGQLVNDSDTIRSEKAHLVMRKNSRPPDGKIMAVPKTVNDEQELRLLRTALVKKRALLTASEQQVKRFQEQLAAAQKVVAVHRSTVVKLTSQIALVRQRVNDNNTETLLKTSDAPPQVRNVTVSKRPKQTLNIRITPKKQRVVRLRKEVSTFTPQQLADEKRRLKQLEQETLRRLQELRQKRGIQTVAPKSTIDAKELTAGSSSPVKKKLLLENDVAPNSPPVVAVKAITNASTSNVAIESVESQTKTQNACRLVESDEYTAATSSPFLSDFPLGKSSREKQVNCNVLVPFDFCNMLNPLTHLRSYRSRELSDCPVNSLTFAHKIDPNWTFCSFDLLGTCNDDQCPWQHLPRTK